MAVFESIDQARAYFEGDRFALENGVTLDAISPGSAVCSMTLAHRHRNAEGGVWAVPYLPSSTWPSPPRPTTSTVPPWPSRSA